MAGAELEAGDSPDGAPPVTAPVSAAVREAVKIALRPTRGNEQDDSVAYVFLRVDGAGPGGAVRVPPCGDALGRALEGAEVAVARAFADPPKAPAATGKTAPPLLTRRRTCGAACGRGCGNTTTRSARSGQPIATGNRSE